jgi:hypothetical protein
MIDRRVSQLGLRLRAEFSTEVTTAVTTETSIMFPAPTLPLTRDQYDLLYGYMVHETGHHTRPEAFKILHRLPLPNQHPLINMFNLVEDNAMEHEVSRGFLGDRIALSKGMTKHIEINTTRLLADTTIDKTNQEFINVMAASKLNIEGRRDFDTQTEQQHSLINTVQTDSSSELYAELIKEGWDNRMAAPMTVPESWTLACDLFKRLYPEVPPEDVEKMKQKGLDPSGDGKDPGEVPPSMEGMGGEGDDKTKKKGAPPTSVTYSWKNWVKSEHDDTKTGIPAIINWEGRKENNEVLLHPMKNIEVVECKDAGTRSHTESTGNAATLANAIRIYIQAKARTKIKPEQYRGKIDRRAITRLAFPPIDGGEWNKKVFYTLDNRKHKNTCIGLLVDWSGSMTGYPMQIAAETVGRLAHVFDTQLHVPVMISAYTTHRNNVIIGRVKEFHTKNNIREISSKLDWFSSYTSGNADGDSLLWMYEQMRRRKEERKILFVMADGAPSDCVSGASPDDVLKFACRAVEADPSFTLYGIGMNTNQPKRYYKNTAVINNMSELDSKLISLMKEVYDKGDQRG